MAHSLLIQSYSLLGVEPPQILYQIEAVVPSQLWQRFRFAQMARIDNDSAGDRRSDLDMQPVEQQSTARICLSARYCS
jgi:hypothetical protein